MHKPQATLPPLRRLRVITYRVTLDVPLQLVTKVSNLLRKRRKELGTRNGTRALTCYQQAVFILAWFRDRPEEMAACNDAERDLIHPPRFPLTPLPLRGGEG